MGTIPAQPIVNPIINHSTAAPSHGVDRSQRERKWHPEVGVTDGVFEVEDVMVGAGEKVPPREAV